ncbi:hypothetical protein [Noviherbaspirillum malthae]|jgi:hypothetical protein|uniref:hypothetical protein n=1 Tax=Noviherbaspirillum malthae TaxID=1260987 RepID=UPI0018906554|nr:hypothetical protein [Noviherbaspirillum malthae]
MLTSISDESFVMTTGQFLALIIFITTSASVYALWRAGKPMLPIGIIAIFGFGSAVLSLYKDTQGSQRQEHPTYKAQDVTRLAHIRHQVQF